MLKERIAKCKKLVALASRESKKSIWVPWEIGIADNKDPYRIDTVAILPIASNYSYWEGAEYLELYPKIHRVEEDDGTVEWFVKPWEYSDNRKEKLSDWLRKKI